jgi:predicted TIM-barrel fold metal-dependent hydrolase
MIVGFQHHFTPRDFFPAGFCGDVRPVKSTIVELPTDRIVFASDYPQEIRKPEAVKKCVDDIRAIGPEREAMLSGNAGLLLKI